LIGQVVDEHEIIRALGTGGTGEVYLARHQRLGLQRAIKIMRDFHHDPKAIERFRVEATVLARLQHNAIVQLVDHGELPDGRPYLLLEHVAGTHLSAMIEDAGPLSIADALRVLEQIAGALAYAHGEGVIHRDLKPGNVILRDGDVAQVKVIDFGLARALDTEAAARLTDEGQLLGSPHYMAPEQADGRLDGGAPVDSYAFACVAYTLLSGRPPFAEQSLLKLIVAHASETPEPLSARCAIPRLLDDLLRACLGKDPAGRPSAEELYAHLTRLSRSTASEARRPETQRTEHELLRFLREPPGEDAELGQALHNQMLAVLDDIARSAPASAALADEVEAASSALTQLELDVALLDSQLDERPGDAKLAAERAASVARSEELRDRIGSLQRRLAARVVALRADAGAETSSLFDELDQLLARLRSATEEGER
jgi:serine/threonine protein kinase